MLRHAVLSALCLLMLTLGCARQSAKVSTAADERTEVRIYEVYGMDCPGCHGGVENLVLKIPAVVDAKASWKEKRLVVHVKTDQQLDDELVFDAIRRANFTPGKRLQ